MREFSLCYPATKPCFPVSLADVRAELDQLFVNGRVHSVRICFVAGALDRYGPLVVGVAGAAPAPVTLVYYEDDAAVLADPVVTTRFAPRREAGADPFRCELPHNAVGRQCVNAVCTFPAMVRAFTVQFTNGLLLILLPPSEGVEATAFAYLS